MGKIKDKVEMELKPYETMCEQTTEHLKMLITGGIEASAEEILTVAKALGVIIDIKKDIVEKCYKMQIMEAMEENADDYGDTWDENGRKFYPRMRDSRGRFMRGYEEPIRANMHMPEDMNMSRNMDRDMDRYTNRRMYTEPMAESKLDKALKAYKDARTNHPNDRTMSQEKINRVMDEVVAMVHELEPHFDNAEKTIVRTKFTNMANSIQ